METEAFIQKCKKIFLVNHEYEDNVFNTFCFELICRKLGITLEDLKEHLQEGDFWTRFLFAKEIGDIISTLSVN